MKKFKDWIADTGNVLLYFALLSVQYTVEHVIFYVKLTWYRINKISYYEGRDKFSPYIRRKTWDSK